MNWGTPAPKYRSGYEETGIPPHFSREPVQTKTAIAPVPIAAPMPMLPGQVPSFEESVDEERKMTSTRSGRLQIVPQPFASGAHGEVHRAALEGRSGVFKRTHLIAPDGEGCQAAVLERLQQYYPGYFMAMCFSPRKGINPRFYGYMLADLGVDLLSYISANQTVLSMNIERQKNLSKKIIAAVFDFNDRAKLVHGDIKPGNITIQTDRFTGEIKAHLVDVENAKFRTTSQWALGPGHSIGADNVTKGFCPMSLLSTATYRFPANAYMDRYALAITLTALFDGALCEHLLDTKVMTEGLILEELKKNTHPLAKVSHALIQDKDCEYAVDHFLRLVDHVDHCHCVIC